MKHYFIAFIKGNAVRIERVSEFGGKPQVSADFIEPNEGTWVTCVCRAVYWSSGEIVDSDDFDYVDFNRELSKIGYCDGIPF